MFYVLVICEVNDVPPGTGQLVSPSLPIGTVDYYYPNLRSNRRGEYCLFELILQARVGDSRI